MKISNKEKIMLYILGLLIIGFGYYNFVYSVQVAKIEEKMKAENEVKQKYTTTIETIKALDDRKNYANLLKATIGDKSAPFYPAINEEKIITELDTLLKDSGLKGGIEFKPVVADAVEAPKKEQSVLGKSSLQGIVDSYNNTTEKNDKVSNDASNVGNVANNQKTNTSNDSNANNSNTNNAKAADGKEQKNKVQYMKIQVKFEGAYDALDKFLDKIATNEKKIIVNSIKMSQDTLNSLKGTMDLEIYSVPKITDELETYLKWDLNNTYGKNVPFDKGGATGVTVATKNNSDFIATIRGIDSELPTVILGKTNDSLKTTYVYADSNIEENVEMILTQAGDKYYYKYKTSKGTYPASYDGLGTEFIPMSKNIEINILSEPKVSTNDKANIKLKVVNKTDKLADVNVSNDDVVSPRVKIDGDGNNISVNQK